MSTRQHEHHHYHHSGGSPGNDWNELFVGALIIGLGLFVVAFWHVILAAVLALVAVGGLGAYVWKLKRHFVQLQSGLFSFRRAVARCERCNKALTAVEARKQAMSDSDYRSAVSYARQHLSEAVGELTAARACYAL